MCAALYKKSEDFSALTRKPTLILELIFYLNKWNFELHFLECLRIFWTLFYNLLCVYFFTVQPQCFLLDELSELSVIKLPPQIMSSSLQDFLTAFFLSIVLIPANLIVHVSAFRCSSENVCWLADRKSLFIASSLSGCRRKVLWSKNKQIIVSLKAVWFYSQSPENYMWIKREKESCLLCASTYKSIWTWKKKQRKVLLTRCRAIAKRL